MVILNSVVIVKGSWRKGYDLVEGIWEGWCDSPIIKEKCIDDKDYYSCIDTVCMPEDYEKEKAPHGVSRIAGNIFIKYSRVQSIYVRQAMYSFTAKLGIVWQDPRLVFCYQTSTEALDDTLLDDIWKPQLKVKKFATEFKIQDKSKSLSQ